MTVLHTLFYFIVAVSLLVAIHEFGHFWVARKTGVKVIRFSIGFGKILWSYQKSPESTEYVIAAIPLGGYVKMVDEREGNVSPDNLPFAFNRQRLWKRTAIVAAGPVFNLLLAVLLFWAALIIGETGMKPVLGAVEAGTLAAQAGFSEGDQIIRVNDETTLTWPDALDAIFSAVVNGEQTIQIVARSDDNVERTRTLSISETDSHNPKELYQHLGFKPWMPVLKPIIGKIVDAGPAQKAGLQKGDVIVSADNGVTFADWQAWVDYVRARPDTLIQLKIERGDVQQAIDLIPNPEITEDGKTIGKIGAGPYVAEGLLESMQITVALSPWDALPRAVERTWFYSTSTITMIGRMFIGHASVENISGPISIAQYAGKSAEMGLVAFLKYLGLISVSLGVLNLLPIPVLDGGHLLFFGIEAVKGSPLTEKAQLYFQQVGMMLLFALMVFAVFLDVGRWLN